MNFPAGSTGDEGRVISAEKVAANDKNPVIAGNRTNVETYSKNTGNGGKNGLDGFNGENFAQTGFV